MNEISNGNYFIVFGWMRSGLNLKGNELILYSIIYSFTQGTREHWFMGSHQFLSNWIGVSRRAIIYLLNSLLDKGLIIKRERIESGVRFCDYRTATSDEQILCKPEGVKKGNNPCEKISDTL